MIVNNKHNQFVPCVKINSQVKPSNMPAVVAHKIFGKNGVANVDRCSGNMLPYNSLRTIPNIGKVRFELGYDYQKTKKGFVSQVPFSLVAATKNDGTEDKEIFVHVPSKKHQETYPGLLGKGWFADTEIAQNLRSREWVAVKCYKHKGDRKISDDLLEKEIEVLQILNMFRGYSEYDGKKNVYMQLIDGHELKEIKKDQMPGKLSSQIQCSISAIRSLEKLHKSNWIHGDIHRGNIMINPKNKTMTLIDFNKAAYLGDSGNAKVIQGGYTINIPGKVHENVDKNDCMELNKHTDRFALGTTLAYMFSGKKHPIKNHEGYIKTLLFKPKELNCSNEEWNELDSCLRLLTDKNGPDDLDFVCGKLQQLQNKLQKRGA